MYKKESDGINLLIQETQKELDLAMKIFESTTAGIKIRRLQNLIRHLKELKLELVQPRKNGRFVRLTTKGEK